MSTLRTYFDLSDEERAALTEERVRDYCKVALMTAGVEDPKEPEFLDETPLNLPKKTYYQPAYASEYSWEGVKGYSLAFETPEQAQTFIALNPVEVETDWSTKLDSSKRLAFSTVKSIQLVTPEHKAANAGDLKRIAENKAKNEKLRADLKKAQADADKVTESIWKDWHEQRDAEQERIKVRAAFVDYVKMAEGNKVVARGFLEKTYGAELVGKALGAPIAEPQ